MHPMLPRSQTSPLCAHLHLADQPSEPHDLPPEEEEAAVLSAEVGVEGLWRKTQEALGTPLHFCPSAPLAWPTKGPAFPQGTKSTQGLDWPPSGLVT